MSEAETLGNACLALEAVGRIAAGARVMLDAPAPDRLARSHRQLESLARAGRVIYGLNTGCGPLCDPASFAGRRGALPAQPRAQPRQRPRRRPHPREVVRATMAVRAHTPRAGTLGRAADRRRDAGRDAECRHPPGRPGDRLGRRERRPGRARARGACAGGRGRRSTANGRRVDAAVAFAEAGLAPVRLEGREALALMNGTSCETAQAALAVLGRASTSSLVAEAAAALVIEVFGGNPEAFDTRVHRGAPASRARPRRRAHLRGAPGGQPAPARYRPRAACPATDGARPVQDAYTLRCVPQVLGAVRATIAHVRDVVAIEINAVTDNPTFFPEDGVVAARAATSTASRSRWRSDHLEGGARGGRALSPSAAWRGSSTRRRSGAAAVPDPRPGRAAQRPHGAAVLRQLHAWRRTRCWRIRRRSARCRPNANNQDVVGMGTVGRTPGAPAASRTRAAWSRSS